MSVITELPFLKSMPPIAGSNAKANGAECHAEVSDSSRPIRLAFGNSKSSVDSWKARRASESERSEKLEDRRRDIPPATFWTDLLLRRFDSSIVKARRRRAPPLVGGGSSAILRWSFGSCHVVVGEMLGVLQGCFGGTGSLVELLMVIYSCECCRSHHGIWVS